MVNTPESKQKIETMDIALRLATENDIEVIFDIRTSVKENHLSKQQLTELGITEPVILSLIQNTSTVWLAEVQHQVCGFSIVDLTEGSIFAMFVHPDFEAKGVGTALLKKQKIYYLTPAKKFAWKLIKKVVLLNFISDKVGVFQSILTMVM